MYPDHPIIPTSGSASRPITHVRDRAPEIRPVAQFLIAWKRIVMIKISADAR